MVEKSVYTKQISSEFCVSENPALEQLLLFCMLRDIDWDVHFDWSPESMRQIKILLHTWTKKSLIFPEKTSDMRTIWHFDKEPFVDKQEVAFDVEKFRQLFHYSNTGNIKRMGNKPEVEKVLMDWLKVNPDKTFSDVYDATSNYIKVMKQRQEAQYIPNPVKFITEDLNDIIANPIKPKTQNKLLGG
jgi:ADP-heptose:LPS heptosyltransferase